MNLTNSLNPFNTGYTTTGSIPQGYYYNVPVQMQFVPDYAAIVSEIKGVEAVEKKTLASTVSAGTQIIYRYGKNPVQTQTLKGVLDSDVAEDMFMEQFGEKDESPEIVASVLILTTL
jgi:hypothetical protein